MGEPAANGETKQGTVPPRPDVRQFQELWFTLARREWRSIVFVPADPSFSTEPLARSLADVGNRVSELPVTAITVRELEYGTALALAELQQRADREPSPDEERTPLIEVASRVVDTPPPEWNVAPGSRPRIEALATKNGFYAYGVLPEVEDLFQRQARELDRKKREALARAPAARLVIAIPAVITEPLGLAAAHQADAVLVAIELGHTRIADVRRTIELIGRERIVGAFLVS